MHMLILGVGSWQPYAQFSFVTSAEICKGGNFLLSYYVIGSFISGKQFIAELSDACTFLHAKIVKSTIRYW